MSLDLKVKKLPNYEGICPREQGNAGFDVKTPEHIMLSPGERKLIKLGFCVSFSDEYFLEVKPRSGLALKVGLHTLAGVIDSSYRNEVGVVLYNTSKNEIIELFKGDRIAQLVPQKIDGNSQFEFVEDLDQTERGSGFGSSGN